MDPRTLPPALIADARAYADGSRVPAEPRAASTVVLLRNGTSREPGSLEAYLLRRHVGMAFAAGMSVFPGGGVDVRDADLPDTLWAGPAPEEWAARMDCTPVQARELVCAAVRETFEESGVLLAGHSSGEVVADTTGESWEADRRALESHALSFSDFLTRRGLVLRSDLLAGLSGWLTPKFEPKRYRTWFFVAALPEGQVTRDVSTESETVAWWTLREALAAVLAGDMLMLPPTVLTLAELYDAGSTAQALEIARALPWEMAEPVFDLATEELVVPERFGALGARVMAQVKGGVA
jgi:8-oxo-dGTP pyrophosphatase MutT (NUDIX family)